MYDSINDFDVLAKNSRNITAILKTELPSVIDRNTVKNLNLAIFHGIELRDYQPGTFRKPAPQGDLNVSSRELKSQGNRTIYSMRSYMDNNALIRFDYALNLIKTKELKQLNTKEFTDEISFIYAALDYTHPFYDGNSRTFRTLTELVAKQAGYEINWKKIASDQYLRDELYCARSIEVNRLAFRDPEQKQFQSIINNMLEDLSDKRDLSGLFTQQKLITPFRSIDFKQEIQSCFNLAKNNPEAFKSAFTLSCLNLSNRHPEINTALKQINSAIAATIKSKEDIKGYQVSAHVILPAFYKLIDQGYQSISQAQFKAAMDKQITLVKQRESQAKTYNKSTPNLTLFLIAGPNGSGKSTIYEHLVKEGTITQNMPFINPDVYAKQLANKHGYDNVNNLPPLLKASVDIQAGKIALKARQTCFNTKQSFAIETTASSRGTIKLIEEAKNKGYKVNVEYVLLKNSELNKIRIKSRALFGEHFIDPEVVERRFNKAVELLPEILAKADNARLFDNSDHFEIVLTKNNLKTQLSPNHNWTAERLSKLVKDMQKFSPQIINSKQHEPER